MVSLHYWHVMDLQVKQRKGPSYLTFSMNVGRETGQRQEEGKWPLSCSAPLVWNFSPRKLKVSRTTEPHPQTQTRSPIPVPLDSASRRGTHHWGFMIHQLKKALLFLQPANYKVFLVLFRKPMLLEPPKELQMHLISKPHLPWLQGEICGDRSSTELPRGRGKHCIP